MVEIKSVKKKLDFIHHEISLSSDEPNKFLIAILEECLCLFCLNIIVKPLEVIDGYCLQAKFILMS